MRKSLLIKTAELMFSVFINWCRQIQGWAYLYFVSEAHSEPVVQHRLPAIVKGFHIKLKPPELLTDS